MKILGAIILLLIGTFSFAQHKQEAIGMPVSFDKVTFDIITYTPPRGWQRASDSNDVVSYAIADNQKGAHSVISIYKSVDGTSADSDFYQIWKLFAKNFNVTANPETRSVKLENGWDLRSGVVLVDFNGEQHQMTLVTMSGNAKVIYINVLSNSQDYQIDLVNFLNSISFPKLEPNSKQASANNKAIINDKTSIIGTWV